MDQFEIMPVVRCIGCACDVAWVDLYGLCRGCRRRMPEGVDE